MNKINIMIPRILKIVFIVVLFSFVLAHKANKPRIMIIHSYLNDYDWVNEINVGFERVFSKYHDVTVRYHYMDLKNHVSDNYRRTSASITHRTIDKWRPDVLILADDLAQILVGSEFVNDPGVKVVFCGVNGKPVDYGYDTAQNVTGILERKPLEATKETLMMMAVAMGYNKDNPDAEPPKVVFIGDNSFTVSAEIDDYSEFDWSPMQWVPPLRAGHFEAWQDAVIQANDIADLVMISDIRQIRVSENSKELVKPDQVMEWTESHSENPILCMARILVVEDGGMMCVAASGYEQGEIAAERARAVALGKAPTDYEIVRTKQFLISIRESTMEKRNLPIPSIYEAFARATDNYIE